MSKKCAFLTTDNVGAYTVDDQLAYEPLLQYGWETQAVSWHNKIDWQQFDVVIIRSTWDYQNNINQFVSVLEKINQSSICLANSLDIVKWNLYKTYLIELQKKDIPIVPTEFGRNLSVSKMKSLFNTLQTANVVVKPLIGASAEDTYWISESITLDELELVTSRFQNREYLAQPFMNYIIDEGEYSLIFFNGEYSHALLKTPKRQDFRVQEFHGGTIKVVVPSHKLIEVAQKAIASLQIVPLYARADLVRSHADNFVLMELELIEPNLYFRTNENAPTRFAQAFTAWMTAMNCD